MPDKEKEGVADAATTAVAPDKDDKGSKKKDGSQEGSKKTDPLVVMMPMVPYTSKPDPDPKPEPPEEESDEMLPALKCEEFERMEAFGLGRGVNATNKSPWHEKSTLQVQEVTPHNIVGTEEGEILKSYVREIWSVEEMKARLGASVTDGSKVTINIDSELSRNYNRTRRSIGQHLVTRSVSFRPTNFKHNQPGACDSQAAGDAKIQTFEERLTSWIIEKVNKKYKRSYKNLDDFIFNKPEEVTDVAESLKNVCTEFITTFSVTHYVSGIQLGAAKYGVLSEEEYLDQIKSKSQLQVLQLVNFAAEGSVKFNWGERESTVTEIGRFRTVKKGASAHIAVKRGSTDEAVVGVDYEPIYLLIVHQDLKQALLDATKKYIERTIQSEAGPFIISCDNEQLFLQVKDVEEKQGNSQGNSEIELQEVVPKREKDEYHVVATPDLSKASLFYIDFDEDGSSAYEFSIMHLRKRETPVDQNHDFLKDKTVKPIPRFLYAPLGLFGTKDGPLSVRFAADDKHSKMTLQNRRARTPTPADTKDWLSSQDVFYICCKDRRFFKDSYISVKDCEFQNTGRRSQNAGRGSQNVDRRGNTKKDRYITCCVTSTQMDGHHTLFRLLRPIDEKDKKKKDEEKEVKESGTVPMRGTVNLPYNLPFGKYYGGEPYKQHF